MNFTNHTARKAAEQITQGKPLEDIESSELSSLVAICEAELQDRDRRKGSVFNRPFAYLKELPF